MHRLNLTIYAFAFQAATAAFNSKISSLTHFDGAASLIKQRKHGQMTELTKKLVVGVRSNIVRS